MKTVSGVGDLFVGWATTVGIALAVMQPDGCIDYANDAFRSLGGLGEGDRFIDAFEPAEADRMAGLLVELTDRGSAIDVSARLAESAALARFRIDRTIDRDGQTEAIVIAFWHLGESGIYRRELEYQIDHDDLTGVLTRAAIIRNLEERFQSTGDANGAPTAVLFVDLDDFKGLNDGYGHLLGDEVLKVVAQRLEQVTSESDRVARIGGDEFLVVLGECGSTEDAIKTARVVSEAIAVPTTVGEVSLVLRVSVGIAIDAPDYPSDSCPALGGSPMARVERLLAEADMAMYGAKQRDVSIAVADESTRLWSTRRLIIERDLVAALESNEIQFHYQPLVDLSRGQWVAAEALLRWQHPKLGMLPPELIIERAEAIGCIDALTGYTIDRVVHDWGEVHRRAPVMFHHQVTINASARQLSWDGFVETLECAVEREQLSPPHVVIEVTESSRIDQYPRAAAALNALARRGFRVSLDDFGVGYSSLVYFTQFPIQSLKIDRGLVAELQGGTEMVGRLLQGVVNIAESLGGRVVGEGIETKEAAESCRSLGIGVGQGYYFGRPMPLDDFCELAPEYGLRRAGDHVVLPTDPQVRGSRARLRLAESLVGPTIDLDGSVVLP